MHTALLQPLDDLKQMANGAGQAGGDSRISFASTGCEREAPEPCS